LKAGAINPDRISQVFFKVYMIFSINSLKQPILQRLNVSLERQKLKHGCVANLSGRIGSDARSPGSPVWMGCRNDAPSFFHLSSSEGFHGDKKDLVTK
jgi:hypothetical protein